MGHTCVHWSLWFRSGPSLEPSREKHPGATLLLQASKHLVPEVKWRTSSPCVSVLLSQFQPFTQLIRASVYPKNFPEGFCVVLCCIVLCFIPSENYCMCLTLGTG